MPDRILADLDDDVVAGLEGLFDLAGRPAETGCLPVDFARVEHAVAATTDVDERRLHRRQHVLHDSQVDVADQRRRRRRCHEMFHDDAVFEHGDLGVARALMRRFGADLVAHDHHPLDGLAPGEELGLAQDRRAATARVTTVATALPLGLQPRRSADALDLAIAVLGGLVAAARLTRLALMDDRVRRIIGGSVLAVVARTGLAAPAAAAAPRRHLRRPRCRRLRCRRRNRLSRPNRHRSPDRCPGHRTRCRRSRRRSAHLDRGHVHAVPGADAGRTADRTARRRNPDRNRRRRRRRRHRRHRSSPESYSIRTG